MYTANFHLQQSPQGIQFPREPLRFTGAYGGKESPYIKERESQNTLKRNSPWLVQTQAFNDIMEILPCSPKSILLCCHTQKNRTLACTISMSLLTLPSHDSESIANKAAQSTDHCKVISVNNDSHILIKPQKLLRCLLILGEMSTYSLKAHKGFDGHQMKFISKAFHFLC